MRDNALDPSFGYDHDYRHTSADPDVHEMQLSRLTPVQRSHFEIITKAVLEGPRDGKNIFFLDAPAGSGKTFFTELMIQALRFKGRLLIPVASTGIAALLLEKGVTAHKCDIIFWDDTCNSEKALQCRLYYIVSTIIFDSKQSPCLLLLSFAALIT